MISTDNLSWSKRNLSILGKVLIIKALIIPIFTFIVSSCAIPEKDKKEIESKCFKFIWNGKPDKVKKNTLIGDFEKGGLKMINIQSYYCKQYSIKSCNVNVDEQFLLTR
jgi:hypothetical protein